MNHDPRHPRAEGAGGNLERPRNRILAALPADELRQLTSSLQRIHLEIRDLLFDVNQPIEKVYFPETCVTSLVGLMADGSAVETATVGNEGMVGMPLFHGTDRTAGQAFCQIGGDVLQLPAPKFRQAIESSPTLVRMLHLYSQALFTLIAQSSACNRLHNMQQRCARWLLLCHDRVGADSGVNQFPLTHQFLSQMLGVRRATVTESMGALQETGAISYEMGVIRVADRRRLENVACECYAIVRSEFDRLLPVAGARSVESPLEGLSTSEAGKTTVGDAVPESGRQGDTDN